MIDAQYKFPSQSVMLDAFRPLGLTVEVEGVEMVNLSEASHAIDVIGPAPFPSSFTPDDAGWFGFVAGQPDALLPMFKRHPKFTLAENGTDPSITHDEAVHVNVRLLDESIDLSALEPFRVTPSTPSRVWA